MNIFFLYDKDEVSFEEKINELKKYIEENKNTYKIKVLSKITSKSTCDLHIIVSDDIEEIYKYFEKIKDKEKILIITSNINASHILGCVNITGNVTYLRSTCDAIIKRINDIYEKNKYK